jgi:hypothetical protein
MVPPAALVTTLLFPSPEAHAGLDACGEVYVEAGVNAR